MLDVFIFKEANFILIRIWILDACTFSLKFTSSGRLKCLCRFLSFPPLQWDLAFERWNCASTFKTKWFLRKSDISSNRPNHVIINAPEHLFELCLQINHSLRKILTSSFLCMNSFIANDASFVQLVTCCFKKELMKVYVLCKMSLERVRSYKFKKLLYFSWQCYILYILEYIPKLNTFLCHIIGFCSDTVHC